MRTRHAAFIRRAARLTTEVSQLPLAAALAALEIAREAGIPTLVDLDVPPSEAVPGLGDAATLDTILRRADLLKPAKAAARELAPGAGADPLAMARALRARFGCGAVVVTDGEAGCAIAAQGFEGCVRARPVKAVDTTGAGDAFLGGLLVALHHGLGWEAAGRLANACGAACAEKLGAFPDDPVRARARVLELYEGPPLALTACAPGNERAHASPALDTLDVALVELAALRGRLTSGPFEAALATIQAATAAGGRVHVTGVGKPEHIARYAASLFCSTGTPATFLHATEVVHGSAGQIVAGDVVIAISNSGETAELRPAVATIRRMGARRARGDRPAGLLARPRGGRRARCGSQPRGRWARSRAARERRSGGAGARGALGRARAGGQLYQGGLSRPASRRRAGQALRQPHSLIPLGELLETFRSWPVAPSAWPLAPLRSWPACTR